MTLDADRFDPRDWTIVKQVNNPWGKVPLTAGGRSLSGRARIYMDQLLSQHKAKDPESRRHHYVPRAYLSQWSSDGARIWTLDTVTGDVKLLGLRHVCVKDNFYRVAGANGDRHNRVELLFGVVDAELRRIQNLFNQLEDPATLEFDDLIGLGVSVAMQRMRTLQQRRLLQQRNAWFIAQEAGGHDMISNDANDPYRLAGVHTKLIYDAMWEASDVMTTRQIEIWHDPTGRFLTCDAPVLVPFIRNVRPNLLSAPYIIWPISPNRVVALSNDVRGEKAVIREADGKLVGMVRKAVEQGRERMIFASHEQYDRLPEGKIFRRRTQVRLRCFDHTPNGKHVPPPGCCVECGEAFSTGPDAALCHQGGHLAAPTMRSYV